MTSTLSGDIGEYFPAYIVTVLQADALDRLKLQQMLIEPEMLAAVEPDLNLVTTLIWLRSVMPNPTKETARMVVRKVVEDLIRRIESPTRHAISGALNRSIRNRRPRHSEID